MQFFRPCINALLREKQRWALPAHLFLCISIWKHCVYHCVPLYGTVMYSMFLTLWLFVGFFSSQVPFWGSCWACFRSRWANAMISTGSWVPTSSSRTSLLAQWRWAGSTPSTTAKLGKTSSSQFDRHVEPIWNVLKSFLCLLYFL